tara:strand:+ start:34730 stop:35419 length:690 start_codon:yes stop_codon:yes gene_type:complete
MKKYTTLFALLILMVACKKNIIGPNRGEISGKITDVYSEPIEGVTVTSQFLTDNQDNENPKYSTINAVSDEYGIYILEEAGLAENEVTITKKGYKEVKNFILLTQDNNKKQVDYTLVGVPVFQNITLSSSTLSIANNDSIMVKVNIVDEYQESQTGSLTCDLIVYNNSQQISLIKQMTLKYNSISNFVFETKILSTDLPQEIYQLSLEFYDSETRVVNVQNVQTINVIN